MIRILLKWIISAASLILVSIIIPGFIIDDFRTALIAAAVLGLLNLLVRPFLIIFTLPINILTLGLFTFIINALMLLFLNSIVKGVEIQSFATALYAAIILWIISFLTNIIAPRHQD